MQQYSSFIGWDFQGETANGAHDFWAVAPGQYPSLNYVGLASYTFIGSGTDTDPYHITTIYDLGAVWQYPEASYVLDNSIDANGTTFSTTVVPVFKGTFDGNGNAIANLTINSTSPYESTCLFGAIKGSVKNLGVENITVSGNAGYIGGICGTNSQGYITNCHCTGTVTSTDYAGGICATNYGTITDCSFSGSVISTAEHTEDHFFIRDGVGGICGRNGRDKFDDISRIINCYSTGSVTSTGDYVGGICGWNAGSTWDHLNIAPGIAGCYSTATVNGYDCVGGLCGLNDMERRITKCYSTGTVSGNNFVGGLCGADLGYITASLWDMETSGQTTSDGGTGKSTTQLQDISTFRNSGWRF